LSTISILVAGAPYLLNGRDPKDILRRINYSMLVFFAAMFVVTSGLLSSGVISMIMVHIPSVSFLLRIWKDVIIKATLYSYE
jgi:Na+/H+ antiporter NhaD/arsenite permease-like protein